MPLLRFSPRLPGARLAAALICCLASRAAGANDIPEFHSRTWKTEDGLPHNSVSRILQDRAGFMWFGTPGGLARFDGNEFKELRLPPEHRSKGYNIRDLAEESAGTLLAISTSGEVVRLRNGEAAPHPIMQTLGTSADAPADIFVEPGGVVWVATYEGRLARWQPDGRGELLGGGASLAPRTKRFTFAIDRDAHTWVASDGFLAVHRSGRLERYPMPDDEPILLAQGRGGRVWVCMPEKLSQIEDGALRFETGDVPWRGAFRAFKTMLEDEDGSLWIALSRQGLLHFANGKTSAVPAVSTTVLCLFQDREGSVWAGTNGEGVYRLRPKSHRIIDASGGLAENVASSVALDSAGHLLLANRTGGVITLTSGGAVSREVPRIYANTAVADRSGRIWFGGGNSGLQFIAAGGTAAPTPIATLQPNVQVLHAARNGDVWFVADPQMGYYRNNEVHMLSAEEGFLGQNIRAVAETASGELWFGGHKGDLLRWRGGRLEPVEYASPQLKASIHDILAGDQGELWIATAEGLVLGQGGRFRIFTRNDGLRDDFILQVAADDAGRLWLVSRSGVFHVNKAELLAVAQGTSDHISSRPYGRNQGMPTISPISDYHPKTARDRDGRLWFATAQGALVIDPASIARDLPAPPVVIDGIRVDGRDQQLSGPVRIPAGAHRIEFRFATPSFTAPENVELNYRLVGADATWVSAGSERSASYVNLPHGAYRLEVRARHEADAWPAASAWAELNLSVAPAWWERPWVRITALLLSVTATVWVVRLFSQRALKRRLERLEQEHALERERARIARDLHDDLGSGLSALDLLAQRIVASCPPDIRPLVHSFSHRSRHLAAEVSSIVWTMESSNSRLDRLASFVRQYAQRLFRHTGVICKIRGVDVIPPVPVAPDPQHQIVAVFKEALANILKHSRASEVEITTTWKNGVFEISIHDNGTGFEATAAPENVDGNGLRNMRSRSAEIGGRFLVECPPGQGTFLRLQVPVPGTPMPGADKRSAGPEPS